MLMQDVFTPSAIQIDIRANVCFIKTVDQLRYRTLIPTAAKGGGEMIVRVKDRKTGSCDAGLFDDQFRARHKILKQQGLFHDEESPFSGANAKQAKF
jgi:hypothetical protein